MYKYLLKFQFFLWVCPKVGLLNHMVVFIHYYKVILIYITLNKKKKRLLNLLNLTGDNNSLSGTAINVSYHRHSDDT